MRSMLTDMALVRAFYDHSSRVNTVCMSPDDKLLVSGGSDKKALVRDRISGEIITVLRHKRWVASVALTDDYLISSDGGGNIYVWEYSDSKLVAHRQAHRSTCRTISLASDHTWFASGGRDGNIHLWHIPTLEPLTSCLGHTSQVRRLAVSPTAYQLVSGDAEGMYIFGI